MPPGFHERPEAAGLLILCLLAPGAQNFHSKTQLSGFSEP